VGRLPGAAGLLDGPVAPAHPRWEAWRTFERFTDQARGVIVDAQAEARGLRHNYIGTEHLLLGLLAQADRAPADVLVEHGVDLDTVRARVTSIVPFGEEQTAGQIPFTPRAKKTLELSLRESLRTSGGRVLPHHLLLGLLREGEGVAAQVLGDLGVDLDALRAAVLASLPPPVDEPETESPSRLSRVQRGRAVSAAVMMTGYTVDPSPEVRRLLMSAGARALDDGRTVISIADVEEALRRRGGSAEPPQASTG
jgi:ATP-dependent Clp protease ATP-binding subunit ClpA